MERCQKLLALLWIAESSESFLAFGSFLDGAFFVTGGLFR
jgi:hypothetical protein